MTSRGAGLLAGSVALWLVGRLLGVRELYIVAVAAAALVLAGLLAVRLSSATVSVRRQVTSHRLLADATADVIVELRNDARLPASLLLVEDRCHYGLLLPHRGASEPPRFVVPGLRSGRSTKLRYVICGRHRGRYTIGPVRIRVRDPFGTAQRVRSYRATDEVVVYPRIEPLGEGIARGTHRGSGASDARRLFNTGDEFYTMREYVTGDDLRQVHWPSTAHRQTLMVRQHELPWQAEATVLCDTRAAAHRGVGADATLERAVSLAASLVWHLADRDYRTRLVTPGDVAAAPVEARRTILDRLAVLEPCRERALAPVLAGLRSAGVEGLVAAVLGVPPDEEPVGRSSDVRGLVELGRNFSGRLAIVIDPGAPGSAESARARDLAALLRGARWRSVVLRPRQRLAEVWPALTAARVYASAHGPREVEPA